MVFVYEFWILGSCDPFLPVSLSLHQNKDTTDSRSRGANNSSNRGGRGGAERYLGRGGSNQFSSNGMWLLLCNFVYLDR